MWVPQVSQPEDWKLKVELPDGTGRSYTVADLKARFQSHTITGGTPFGSHPLSAILQLLCNAPATVGRTCLRTNQRTGCHGASARSATRNGPGSGCATSCRMRASQSTIHRTTLGMCSSSARKATELACPSGRLAIGSRTPCWYVVQRSLPALTGPRKIWGMNGAPLPPDHGAPLRVLLPGYVAARSVKWLSKIAVAEEESTSQWQRADYRVLGPNVTKNPDWDSALPIQGTMTPCVCCH
jgi:sulfite oxidase